MTPRPTKEYGRPSLHDLDWYGRRKPVFSGHNELTLLKRGSEQFAAMVEQIDQARHSVWMATYLVSPLGESGKVLEALMRAARRGVAVHFTVDGVGSRTAPASLWSEMRAAGVRLVIYRPLHGLLSWLDTSLWRRMHMKLCVVDESCGFVGGINLIDDRYDIHHGWSETPRLDYALMIRGPVVAPIHHTVQAIWTRADLGRDWRDDMSSVLDQPGRLKRLRQLWRKARLSQPKGQTNAHALAAEARTPVRCAFVLRDNTLQRRTIERVALRAIQDAKHRIDIVTPYFYPARALRHALSDAATRGVQVRLLFQGKMLDYRIAGIAARVLYSDLQRRGVRIFEYQPAFLHAKVACIDDEWSTVGSSNLDPLSLVLNLEANLLVRDSAFTSVLRQAIDEDFSNSLEVPATTEPTSLWRVRLRRASVGWLAKTYLRLAGVSGRY